MGEVHVSWGLGKADGHELNPDARVLPEGRLIYPASSDGQIKLL